jgi:hypothetical protein
VETGQFPQRHQEGMHIMMLTKITIVRNIIDLKGYNRHPVQDREKESITSLINTAASIVLNVIDMVIVDIHHRLLQNKTENDPNERNNINTHPKPLIERKREKTMELQSIQQSLH